MNLSAAQLQLAVLIDAHVNHYLDTELGDEQLLRTIYDYMDAFKRIMDCSTNGGSFPSSNPLHAIYCAIGMPFMERRFGDGS